MTTRPLGAGSRRADLSAGLRDWGRRPLPLQRGGTGRGSPGSGDPPRIDAVGKLRGAMPTCRPPHTGSTPAQAIPLQLPLSKGERRVGQRRRAECRPRRRGRGLLPLQRGGTGRGSPGSGPGPGDPPRIDAVGQASGRDADVSATPHREHPLRRRFPSTSPFSRGRGARATPAGRVPASAPGPASPPLAKGRDREGIAGPRRSSPHGCGWASFGARDANFSATPHREHPGAGDPPPAPPFQGGEARGATPAGRVPASAIAKSGPIPHPTKSA